MATALERSNKKVATPSSTLTPQGESVSSEVTKDPKAPKPGFIKVTPEMRAAAEGLYFVIHESFFKANALKTYHIDPKTGQDYPGAFMPDEMTRAFAQGMHYAAYRLHKEKTEKGRALWREQYYGLRDCVLLGNRKLIYRAVRRWMPHGTMADDMIGDCQIVMIQAVSAFNPWMGIRFSTYAFTCLMRALSRLSQKLKADRLARSVPLETLADGEPRDLSSAIEPSAPTAQIDEFLKKSHSLLNDREKLVLTSRFCLDERPKAGTLEQVGKELGLSKERVRQVQTSALSKLRAALGPAVLEAAQI
jgi:RNA polymerase sigma factor (sigma-70 family)